MASEKVSRKMVLEIKYVIAVIHTENSKILLDLNCSPKELEKTVVNSCGIEHSAAKRGFTDHSLDFLKSPSSCLFAQPLRVLKTTASRPNIFYPEIHENEIHEVDLWQV